MDQSLWQTLESINFLHSSHRWIQTVLSCGKYCQTMQIWTVQDTDFAWDLEDSKSTSGGTLCVFGSHTFVPKGWMCKKQTAVSNSPTESEIISLDIGLRLDGLLVNINPLFLACTLHSCTVRIDCQQSVSLMTMLCTWLKFAHVWVQWKEGCLNAVGHCIVILTSVCGLVCSYRFPFRHELRWRPGATSGRVSGKVWSPQQHWLWVGDGAVEWQACSQSLRNAGRCRLRSLRGRAPLWSRCCTMC